MLGSLDKCNVNEKTKFSSFYLLKADINRLKADINLQKADVRLTKMNKKYWEVILRSIIKINEKWVFNKEGAETMVNLPHTWNAIDGQDGGNDYYRGICTYTKELMQPVLEPGDQVYLEFRGVNSSADVSVNGKQLFHHDGGYSTFRVNITEVLKENNEIIITADNRPNQRVYPQKADFTFYGGIYRDVYLIVVPQAHFDLDYYGAPGIQVTSEINGSDASVTIKAFITGDADAVRFSVDGIMVEAPVNDGIAQGVVQIENVHLWNGRQDPFLYSAKAQLIVGGIAVDEISTSFGCRTFHFDKNEGFFLNGQPYSLRGVSRHQDRKGVGNAITQDMMKEDIELIAELGANTIRLAHYQHDQYFYDLCDRYGMIVWAEIPYISEHMPEGRENTVSQLKELIAQNYNHPSILCWGLSNEITISRITDDLIENHRILNDLAHRMDSTRPTVMANVNLLDINHPILEIPDINSYNLYYGWYFGNLKDNERWFDEFHAAYPDRVIGLSEYGADASPKLQTQNPEKGDYSEQYQAVYHEHMLKVIMDRPYIWATHLWNMFDFGADGRSEGGNHGVNQKGLVTFDRKLKKDAFYLYKAYLSDEPFVHLCGRRYMDRTEDITEIKVYSNQNRIALYDNETLVAEQEGSKVFVFKLPLTGNHTIEVRSRELTDTISIRKVSEPNPSYILADRKINNWYEEPGMEFPEGYYSIKDTIKDVKNTPEGALLMNDLLSNFLDNMKESPMNFDRDVMETMIEAMVLEDIFNKSDGSVSKDMVIQLNQTLNKIKK